MSDELVIRGKRGDFNDYEKFITNQSSIDFDEAQKMLREQRTRYIEYLVANEKIKRCEKVKRKRL